jgi:hypothetical protein
MTSRRRPSSTQTSLIGRAGITSQFQMRCSGEARIVALRMLVGLPALPPDVKNHLASELDRWASESQKSLERHAEVGPPRSGQTTEAIRDHPLTTVAETSSPPAVPSSESDPPARGRAHHFMRPSRTMPDLLHAAKPCSCT